MDKVRAFLRVVWLQRFWVLSVVGTLAAVLCWMMAAGNLQAEYKADKQAIEAQFSNIAGLSKNLGNPAVNAKEREEAAKIADSVRKLWQELYEKQRESVLKWPDHLGPDFLAYIEKRKFDSPIKPDMRTRYLDYIKGQFDVLVKIVDARKDLDSSAAFGPGGEDSRLGFRPGALGPDGLVEEKYLVEWADQNALRAKLNFTAQPSARKVWVTQEDLWVYETLLKVIRNTNKERGATRPDNTAIRVIQMLDVGPAAAQLTAEQPQILMPAGAMDATGGEVVSSEVGPPGGEYPVDGSVAPDPDAGLLAFRYVDAEGKPIPDASTGLAVEYRRLPIIMKLSMDPSWIPTVLVECANATLPIEVTRIRINPEKSGQDKLNQPFEMPSVGGAAELGAGGYGSEGGGIYGGRGGEYGSGGIGRPGEFGGRGGGIYGGGERGGAYSSSVITDVKGLATVDIHGLVYIYNPPDTTSLTVPGGEETVAATSEAVVR